MSVTFLTEYTVIATHVLTPSASTTSVMFLTEFIVITKQAFTPSAVTTIRI
jgi:hypothetical protein